MIKQLEIKNYALIQKVKLDFDKGLTVITGETGAGKSILLGGLSLILGKRAQSGLLNDADKKSIVEAEFDIGNYKLQNFFNQYDIDYETESIIRRELLPGGKSRAFINDTPVKLDVLSNLTDQLIDIHSQHQTLELADKKFQLDLVDAMAENKKFLEKYAEKFTKYNDLIKEINQVKEKLQNAQEELEYKNYQLQELDAYDLDRIDFEALEQRLKQLEHSEEIGEILTEAHQKINNDELGIHIQLIDLRNSFRKIAGLSSNFEELAERLESMQIELGDISLEIDRLLENNEYSPNEKEELQAQFDTINRLLLKHKALKIDELISLRDKLSEEVMDLSSLENQLNDLQTQLTATTKELNTLATHIRQNREKIIPKLVSQIERVLKKLSMPHTRIQIKLVALDHFTATGKDDLEFQISSNDGKTYGSIKQIASGGELSRIMLAVKTILSKYKKLPTIVFDEIDSGISGEVAQNMADVLQYLAQNMQVIVITHLPQIAAAGTRHYKVYKTKEKDNISSNVKLLTPDERVYEIAEMIEGKSPSESALNHAKHLLGKG